MEDPYSDLKQELIPALPFSSTESCNFPHAALLSLSFRAATDDQHRNHRQRVFWSAFFFSNSHSYYTSSSQVNPLVSSFQAHQFYLDCLFVPIITSFVLLSLFLFPAAQSLRTFTVSKICATSTTTNSSNQGSSSVGTSVQYHTACSFLHVWIISDFCFFSLLNVANVAFLHSAISPNRHPPNFPSLHAAKTRVFSATTHQPFWKTQKWASKWSPCTLLWTQPSCEFKQKYKLCFYKWEGSKKQHSLSPVWYLF